MVSAADPAGHLTRLHYDRFGRLTTLINPNRESWRFEYDATGRLTGQRDYAGRLTEYRHDALGQVTEVIRHPLPGSGEAPLVTAFEYDVLGRLTARETADHRTEYRHDTLSLEIRRATRAEWHRAAGRARTRVGRCAHFHPQRGERAGERGEPRREV
ncbi:hypothetical protein [Cronobacter dublinensis]|uniref:hypothetical protein n=1 Tax=Cronobacter dublinensis TaxID=413497 RepID=UPI001F21ECE1|nr:hypothetical protein [Cronobacter dublinensis]